MHKVHAPEVQCAFLADRHISSSITVGRVVSTVRQFRQVCYPCDRVAMATKTQLDHNLTSCSTLMKLIQSAYAEMVQLRIVQNLWNEWL